MSWRVQWTNRALRVMSRLDQPTRARILERVETFASTGHADVKRLKGAKQHLLRIRVGDWRVFLSKEKHQVLLIRAVRPRGDAY